MADIRRDGRLVKDTNSYLGVGGFRANLEVGIAHTLTDSVYANEGTRAKEVLSFEGARSHGVLFSPDAVHVFGEEL